LIISVNHFDVFSEDPQSSYAEAERIGTGYARIIHKMLPSLVAIKPGLLSIRNCRFRFKKRIVSQGEIKEARRILHATCRSESGKPLTSGDLAKGHETVLRLSAKRLLCFAARESGRIVGFPLVALRFGRQAGIVLLPGEPFTEIGLEIKRRSLLKPTFVVTLANGSCGYVPNPECFGRGGYETRPDAHAGASSETAVRMIQSASGLLIVELGDANSVSGQIAVFLARFILWY
jgi:hypothetical protein